MTELELEKERTKQYLELIKLLQEQLKTANEKCRQYEALILNK